ncbi:MAG: hypothetical protein ABEI86_06250 [Halobacteriaceae archaeon]
MNFEIQRDRIEDQFVSGLIGGVRNLFELLDDWPALFSGPDRDGISIFVHGGAS